VYLVWDYVPGTPIGALGAGAAGLSGRELIALARELVLTVESLHAAGIVHGAIGPGNVIVDPHRRPRLTHVSPLLHTDPARDAAAVVNLLRTTVARLGAADAGWDEALAGTEHVPLRELGTRLAGLRDGQEPTTPPAPEPPPPPPAPRTITRPEPARPGPWHRFWSLLAAAAAAAAGLAIFLGVWWYTSVRMTNDQTRMTNEVRMTNDE
jgi:serine/threonine protein kinase